MLIGYARVSTRVQETHLQLDALRGAGAQVIYQEKTSSVGSRPELHRLLGKLSQGDVLVVYKFDRVARSLKDLLDILDRVKGAGAAVRSLTEPLDTSGPLGQFMLQVLGAFAQLERSMIRERTVAGQVAFARRGGVFGRPKKLTFEQEEELLFMCCCGVSMSHVARLYGVSLMVVRRVREEAAGRTNTGRFPVLSKYLQ